MDKKRKLPARASARVSLSKKRKSTTPSEPSRPSTPAPPVKIEEPLPTKIQPGKPLPVLDEPQPENLPNSQYQTVAESGVIAESLERSKKRWLCEGVFERYWTKPKKKNEPLNNPPKETMHKFGACTITIEPHIFDAVMYVVKDATPRPPPPQPMYRPIIQYGPPPPQSAPSPRPPQPAYPTPYSNPQASPSVTSPATRPLSTPAPVATPTAALLQNGHPPARSIPQQSPAQSSAPPPTSIAQTPSQLPAPAASAASAAPTAPAQAKSGDPVIQMLAERAATDQDLKALMRVVADGKATQDQLRQFQAHIDELTLLAKTRAEAAAQAQAAAKPPAPAAPPPAPAIARPPAPPPQQHTPTQRPSPLQHPPLPNGASPASRPYSSPAPAPVPTPTISTPQSQTQASRPKPLPPPPSTHTTSTPTHPTQKPDITALAIEFTGPSATGDRFLFPPYSILEFLPSGIVMASFLIVRRGSESAYPGRYDPEKDYWQPVTVKIWDGLPVAPGGGGAPGFAGPGPGPGMGGKGKNESLRSVLEKIVKPPHVVREYMNKVMDECTRAEYIVLAMRLPRANPDPPTPFNDKVLLEEKQGAEVVHVNGANGNSIVNVNGAGTGGMPLEGVLWTTPANEPVNVIVKRRPLPSKPMVSEEEQYRRFVESVAAEPE